MKPFGQGDHLHLIDGSGFIFRAFHALPSLTRKSDGLPIGAVAGFCNMLQRYLETNQGEASATHIAVVFDKGSHTFRNDLYDQYKANREAMPEDLRPQIPLTRDATRAFGIVCLELEGYEADDIIATLARQADRAGGQATIISSDKDLMQLVGGGVSMLDAMKNKHIGPEEVHEKFGVNPDRVIDIQALAGDSVDNIPGAPGIGVKTAALLINEFGDLETLLERAEEIKQPKRRQTLIEYAEQIRLSKALVTLDDNVPIDVSLDSLLHQAPDADTLMGFLKEMEFRSLTARIAKTLQVDAPEISTPGGNTASPDNAAFPPITESKTVIIRDTQTLEEWISRAKNQGYFAVDTETTSLNEMIAELVGISIAVNIGEAAYIPLTHLKDDQEGLFASKELADNQIPRDQALSLLQPLLEDQSVLKIGQNIKYDYKIFARYGIFLSPIEDTMLLSYALHGGLHGHGMDQLSERYLEHSPIPIKDLIGSGKSQKRFDQVQIEEAAPYAAEDAEITLRLWKQLKPQLSSAKVSRVYEKLERPLIPVLARMEREGILVDRSRLSRMSSSFAQKMAALEAEIHELAGESFNVASPKQLGEILFDKMSLPGGKRGKTGAWATPADVLEDLATEHDLPARVLDWRALAKLKSTYTDALQEHINAETGRVHTSYSIAGASTGRLASTDPNLQNIPIRSEEGRQIREAFIAPEGRRLISLDYSQIELRILAHIAEIDALKSAFKQGLDIHAMTASEMFDTPIEGMDPMIRRQAKAINFGVIYGISAFGLARNLRIPRGEAQSFIDRYFERFPGIRSYMDHTIEEAKRNGGVRTLFGRHIHTPNISSKGPHAGFARRAAINAPIQGTAADIIRRAMIRMEEAIHDLDAKMLLQVHDELVFEASENAVEPLINCAKEIMEGAALPLLSLDVPLIVEAGVGQSWAKAH